MMATPAIRLRRAVRYPASDSGSDSEQLGTTGLDEQQQEELISSLAQDDADTIATYRKALMGICLLGLMLVNLRADYKRDLFFNLGSIASLILSFLVAYDVHVPQAPKRRPQEHEARQSAGWSDLDIGAVVQRGIDARGAGVGVLIALRDGVNLLRQWAEVLDPSVCALLGFIGMISGEGWTLLLGAAPAIGEFYRGNFKFT